MVSKAPESIISAAIASLKALLASPINYNSFIFNYSQVIILHKLFFKYLKAFASQFDLFSNYF